tara:strand:- start:141 stop:341 length:201 start_codon:yes stop_codon:yes gene_type:complete
VKRGLLKKVEAGVRRNPMNVARTGTNVDVRSHRPIWICSRLTAPYQTSSCSCAPLSRGDGRRRDVR